MKRIAASIASACLMFTLGGGTAVGETSAQIANQDGIPACRHADALLDDALARIRADNPNKVLDPAWEDFQRQCRQALGY